MIWQIFCHFHYSMHFWTYLSTLNCESLNFCFEIILEKYLLLGEDSVNSLHCAVFSTFLCDMIWRVKWIIGWKLVQFVLNSSFYLIAWFFFFQGQDRQVSWLPWWRWRRICCHIQGERSFGGNCCIWFPLRSQA